MENNNESISTREWSLRNITLEHDNQRFPKLE